MMVTVTIVIELVEVEYPVYSIGTVVTVLRECPVCINTSNLNATIKIVNLIIGL